MTKGYDFFFIFNRSEIYFCNKQIESFNALWEFLQTRHKCDDLPQRVFRSNKRWRIFFQPWTTSILLFKSLFNEFYPLGQTMAKHQTEMVWIHKYACLVTLKKHKAISILSVNSRVRYALLWMPEARAIENLPLLDDDDRWIRSITRAE